MAGNPYLKVGTNNIPTEQASAQSSAGAGDAGKIVALNSSGLIDNTMLPTSSALTFTASEAISAGALVNIWNNGGTINARNADNTSYKPAHGYAPSAISNGASGTVYFGDGPQITGLSSLTVGGECFLGAAGAITQTAPASGSGKILQKVGVANSATAVDFWLGSVIQLA